MHGRKILRYDVGMAAFLARLENSGETELFRFCIVDRVPGAGMAVRHA